MRRYEEIQISKAKRVRESGVFGGPRWSECLRRWTKIAYWEEWCLFLQRCTTVSTTNSDISDLERLTIGVTYDLQPKIINQFLFLSIWSLSRTHDHILRTQRYSYIYLFTVSATTNA